MITVSIFVAKDIEVELTDIEVKDKKVPCLRLTIGKDVINLCPVNTEHLQSIIPKLSQILLQLEGFDLKDPELDFFKTVAPETTEGGEDEDLRCNPTQ